MIAKEPTAKWPSMEPDLKLALQLQSIATVHHRSDHSFHRNTTWMYQRAH